MHTFSGDITLAIVLLAVWSILWKGYALWFAVKNNQKKWFVAILVLNTIGILEIIYIFGVLKKKWSDVEKDITKAWAAIK